MTKPVIYFDVDGVLLDWQRGFARYVASSRGKGHVTKEFFQTSKSYGLDDLGIWGPGEFIADLAAFEQHHEFRLLKPLVDPVWLTMVANSGFSVQALTAGGGTNERSRQSRRFNLAAQFGNLFEAVHFVGWKANKAEWMAERAQKGVDVFGIVEDKFETLVECDRMGFGTYGVRDFHNKGRNGPSTIEWFPDTEQVCLHLASIINA